MVQDIITYPDKRINIISPDLRIFDEDLFSVIQDLKDTMKAKQVDAMAAIQIAVPMSVIVIKNDDGSYLEIINPRIIRKSGSIDSMESSLYFPNVTQNVKRYEKINLIYQDREGKQHSLKAQGEFALLLQRKIDYVYGATLANRMKDKGRKEFEKELSAGGVQGSFESCPTVFKRDYVSSVLMKILFFILIANIASFFVSPETLVSIQKYVGYGIIITSILVVVYFFVGYYELKIEKSCTSCKMGLVTANTLYYALATIILASVSYFFLKV
jgi:peptide deformylase